jgi:hypothetical protein
LTRTIACLWTIWVGLWIFTVSRKIEKNAINDNSNVFPYFPGDPDYKMKCIGFWKENLKSYLITYDELDPLSKYRCWVYQRADLNRVLMSQGLYKPTFLLYCKPTKIQFLSISYQPLVHFVTSIRTLPRGITQKALLSLSICLNMNVNETIVQCFSMTAKIRGNKQKVMTLFSIG